MLTAKKTEMTDPSSRSSNLSSKHLRKGNEETEGSCQFPYRMQLAGLRLFATYSLFSVVGLSGT